MIVTRELLQMALNKTQELLLVLLIEVNDFESLYPLERRSEWIDLVTS
jgi:hypothetical protein